MTKPKYEKGDRYVENPNVVQWNSIFDWQKDLPEGKVVSFNSFADEKEICPVCMTQGYLTEGFIDPEREDGWSMSFVCETCGVFLAGSDYVEVSDE